MRHFRSIWTILSIGWVVFVVYIGWLDYVKVPWLRDFYWITLGVAFCTLALIPPACVYIIVGLMVLIYRGATGQPT